jgi:adenylate cyclase
MVAAFERSIQLNPNSAVSYGGLGTFLSFSGRPDDAIANLEKAMRLSPRDPQMYMWLAAMGWAHFSAMRYEDAASWLERSLQHRPGSHITQRALAASYAQLGRLDEAQMALREYLRFAPDESVSKVRSQIQYADSAFLDPFLDGLRKAGLKE